MPSALFKVLLEHVIPKTPFNLGDNKTSRMIAPKQLSTIFSMAVLKHMEDFGKNPKVLNATFPGFTGAQGSIPTLALDTMSGIPTKIVVEKQADGSDYVNLVDWIQSSIAVIQTCVLANQVAATALRAAKGMISNPVLDMCHNGFNEVVQDVHARYSPLRASWLRGRVLSSGETGLLPERIPGGVPGLDKLGPFYHPHRVEAWLRLVAQPNQWNVSGATPFVQWVANQECYPGVDSVGHTHTSTVFHTQHSNSYKWAIKKAALAMLSPGIPVTPTLTDYIELSVAMVTSWSNRGDMTTPNNEAYFANFETEYAAALKAGDWPKQNALESLQVPCFLPTLRKNLAILRRRTDWPQIVVSRAEAQWLDVLDLVLKYDLMGQRAFYSGNDVKNNATFWFAATMQKINHLPLLAPPPSVHTYWSQVLSGLRWGAAQSGQVEELLEQQIVQLALGAWMGLPAYICKNQMATRFAWPLLMHMFSGDFGAQLNGKEGIWLRSPFACTTLGAEPTPSTWNHIVGGGPSKLVLAARKKWDADSAVLLSNHLTSAGWPLTLDLANYYFTQKKAPGLASYIAAAGELSQTYVGIRRLTEESLWTLRKVPNYYFVHVSAKSCV